MGSRRMAAARTDTERTPGHRARPRMSASTQANTASQQTTNTRRAAAAPYRHVVVQLLNLLKANADLPEVEQEFRKDPVLSYKLLRFVNSAASGFQKEINSFRQAITILGYHQLYRWMIVLLVTADAHRHRPDLVQSALTRARFLELVGMHHFDRKRADDMFIVGAFSRLAEILELPADEALRPLGLSEEIRGGLVEYRGFHGAVLRLAEAIEAADEAQLDEWIEKTQVEFQIVYDSYNAAIDWVAQLPL
jgi:EAL and modified HD-GYP domain-containing signal transduction protein